MNNLKAKLKKQGGFTLVELLIVVAIIAILVAVSIPMMNNALERSRHAVDQANVRDAMALATVEYMTNSEKFTDDTTTFDYKTNAAGQGFLAGTGYTGFTPEATATVSVVPQCKCDDCDATGGLTVTVTKDGKVSTNWVYSTADGYTKAS